MLGRFAELLGPIFAKEVVDVARRRRYYLTRVFYGCALLFVLFLVWQEWYWSLRRAGGINAMARVAEAFFLAFSAVQYAAVFLFVPLFLGGVIAGEREERTLELLFTTQLSDREIVLGKLASRVAALVLLILCGLPVISAIMLMGGIDPEALGRIWAATLLATLYVSAHAIYFSATTKGTLGALVRTYWWLMIWLVAVPAAVMWPVTASRAGPAVAMFCGAVLLFVNPLGPFYVAMDPATYTVMTGYVGPWFYPLTFVFPAAVSLVLIGRATRRLRYEPVVVPLLTRSASGLLSLGSAKHQPGAASKLWGRSGANRTLSGHRVANPLWLRARRARVFDREGHLGRIQWAGWLAALFFIVLVAIVSPRDIDDEECSMAFLSFTWAGIALLAAVTAGVSAVGDRRRGFLELVLTTPLSGREVVDGTFLAVWEHLKRLYGLPWVLGLFFCLTGASLPTGTLLSLITATLFCALLVYHGIACSLAARTVPTALATTLVFPIGVLAAVPLLIPVFEEDHGPVFWVLCVFFLVGTSYWVRRQLSAASVTCHLTAVHLALGALFTCWTFDGRDEYPIAAMNAGFATITLLDDRPDRWFDRHVNWYTILLCYWTALVVNLIWVHRWLIRHFDPLVERTGPTVRRKSAPRRLVSGAAGDPDASPAARAGVS